MDADFPDGKASWRCGRAEIHCTRPVGIDECCEDTLEARDIQGDAMPPPRHCERSEAIQRNTGSLDCVVARAPKKKQMLEALIFLELKLRNEPSS
jgi:hypothetical protein